LFTGDWVKKTRVLTLAAKGAWIDLLCVMNDRGGTVCWPIDGYARQWSTTEDEALQIISQFGNFGTADVEIMLEDGLWQKWQTDGKGMAKIAKVVMAKITNRRMARGANKSEEISQVRREAGLKGASKRWQKNDGKNGILLSYPNLTNKKKTLPLEAIQVANLLAEWILKNNPKVTQAKESQLNSWAEEADRMERIDGHSYREIVNVIEWSQRNDFWKRNILSVGKLREKWNVLTGQMIGKHGGNRQKGEFVG